MRYFSEDEASIEPLTLHVALANTGFGYFSDVVAAVTTNLEQGTSEATDMHLWCFTPFLTTLVDRPAPPWPATRIDQCWAIPRAITSAGRIVKSPIRSAIAEIPPSACCIRAAVSDRRAKPHVFLRLPAGHLLQPGRRVPRQESSSRVRFCVVAGLEGPALRQHAAGGRRGRRAREATGQRRRDALLGWRGLCAPARDAHLHQSGSTKVARGRRVSRRAVSRSATGSSPRARPRYCRA